MLQARFDWACSWILLENVSVLVTGYRRMYNSTFRHEKWWNFEFRQMRWCVHQNSTCYTSYNGGPKIFFFNFTLPLTRPSGLSPKILILYIFFNMTIMFFFFQAIWKTNRDALKTAFVGRQIKRLWAFLKVKFKTHCITSIYMVLGILLVVLFVIVSKLTLT
jgi:hypothetical protein